MNRLKLWLYVVLLLGAGAGNLYFLTGWLTARSIAHIDRELRSSAAVVDARIRLAGAAASSVADAAARAPTVVAAFADPAATPLAPAEEAVFAASETLGPDTARTSLVAVAGPQGVSARSGGSGGKSITAPEALLVEAQAGRRTQAWVRLDGTLWMVAAVPAGRGGAVAVGIPLDGPFVQALRGATGVDFTVAVDGKVAATTLGAGEAADVTGAQPANGRRPIDVGRLGRIKAALDWPAPAMPILFANPPAARALSLPLEGAGTAALVITQATAPFFSGLAAYQLLALVAMALFLLVGVLLGLFMSEESETSAFPRELVGAADRVARGDFSARAPALAGSAGTIAAALNRAAEAAQHAPAVTHRLDTNLDDRAPAAAVMASEAARSGAPAEPSSAGETVATESTPAASPPVAELAYAEPAAAQAAVAETTGAEESASESESESADSAALAPGESTQAAADAQQSAAPQPESSPAASDFAPAEPAAESVTTETADEAQLSAAEAAPATEAAESAETPPPSETGFSPWTMPADSDARPEPGQRLASALESATNPEPAVTQPIFAPFGDEDESHWRAVFDDFVRLRTLTGESAEGLDYERFRSRLERNREQLKDKHGARTVRFQPYVKDGKAALRATPVR